MPLIQLNSGHDTHWDTDCLYHPAIGYYFVDLTNRKMSNQLHKNYCFGRTITYRT